MNRSARVAPESTSHDFAVVGGGLVGLASAWTLLRRIPGATVVVLEKDDRVGQQQSGHNSGVVHAGLYYRPGSLKSRLCADGRHLLREFCEEFGVAYRARGKLVVALDELESSRLNEILDRARLNGVKDARIVSGDELTNLEPHVRGLRALHSPSTAVVDFPGVCRALEDEIKSMGGEVRKSAHVTGLREGATAVRVRYQDPVEQRVLHATKVLVCAGLHSDRLAREAGGDRFPSIVPFRGEYFTVRPEAADLVNGLIYPVPDPRYPFLGVHLTKGHDGSVHVGPNAVLALAREGYSWADWNRRDIMELLASRGLRSFARAHWRTGIAEVWRSLSVNAFVRDAQRYLPALRRSDLVKAGAGVRAQAMRSDGTLEEDFVLEHRSRIVSLRNAPSPAATSCLAIGDLIVDRLMQD